MSSCNAHIMDIYEASSTKSLLSTILSDHGSFCFHRILSLSCSNNVPIFGSETKMFKVLFAKSTPTAPEDARPKNILLDKKVLVFPRGRKLLVNAILITPSPFLWPSHNGVIVLIETVLACSFMPRFGKILSWSE